MASYNYTESTNSNLICCICRMPFIDPVTTRACSHTFCRECILEALKHSLHCPVDRLPLTIEGLEHADPIIRSLVDELLVRCPSEGCDHVCQRDLLHGHLLDACQFVLVPCPDKSCTQSVQRHSSEGVKCIHTPVVCSTCESEIAFSEYEEHCSTCADSSIVCEHCDSELRRADQESHLASCQSAPISCVHSSHGCLWAGQRRSLESHTPTCPYEAIKGFLTLHSTNMTALQEENALLRAKVDALQGHIRSSNRDLQAVKSALGPWYMHSAARPSSELPIHIQHHVASTSSHHDSSTMTSTGSPSEGPGTFASYFPPESPASTSSPNSGQPNHTPQERRNAQRTSPNISYNWDPASLTSRSVARDVVAPIDLSTTLEGSLNGLRESMVTLTTTVESLGRRNEIALTNETLRLNEEIMSIRAHMHGLRMQVCLY
ncbi:hypothetical protein BDZ89DRAFT_528402 [Hymenopellis radicata]|nr:hypothetical protein BDZ89DRAFT_528402 [Hymenopellis radicata]